MPNTLLGAPVDRLRARVRAARDRLDGLIERLFTAYFMEGRNIGDRRGADRNRRNAGYPGSSIAAASRRPSSASASAQRLAAAAEEHVPGVPYFVFNDRLALSGAQPPPCWPRWNRRCSRAMEQATDPASRPPRRRPTPNTRRTLMENPVPAWTPSPETIKNAKVTAFIDWLARERGIAAGRLRRPVALVGDRHRRLLGRRLGLLRHPVGDAARQGAGRCPHAGRGVVPRRRTELRRTGLPPRDRHATGHRLPQRGRRRPRRLVGRTAAPGRRAGRHAARAGRRPRRPRRRLHAQHPRIGHRLPRRRQPRRHLVGVLARHGPRRGARPLPPDRTEGA